MKTKFAAAMMITVAAGSLMAGTAGAAEVTAARGPGRFGPPPHHEWREPAPRREWREPPPPHHDMRPPSWEWGGRPPHDRFEPPHHGRPVPPPPMGRPRGPVGVPPRH